MLDEWGIKKKEVKKEENKEEKRENINVFHVMYSALNKDKEPPLSHKRKIPEHFFVNILSNNPNTVSLALFFTTHDVPVEKQYDLVRITTPKIYIPYPKKQKIEEDEFVEELSNFYKISQSVAREYISIMPENVKNIYKEMLLKKEGKR